MKKRLLALLLAAVMLFALAACGGSESAVSSAPAEAPASAEAEAPAAPAEEAPAAEEPAAEAPAADAPATLDEPIVEDPEGIPAYTPYDQVPATELPLGDGTESFEIWMGANPNAMNYISSLAENRTYKEIMDRTGVNWTFIHFHPSTQTEEFNLVMASGDYPDAMNGVANQYVGGADKAIEEEVFLDLNEYLADYAPHYYALIHSDETLYAEVTTPGGAAVGFYSLYKEARLNDMGYLIRQDWLNELKMDKPTTMDELHDVLAAFKDEKGASDPLFIPATGVSDYFTSAYGVASGMYLDNGVMKYGPLEEGFKDYLQTMAKWYAEDLIYHDFPFYGEELSFRDPGSVGAGKVACFYSETGDMAMFGDFSEDEDILFTAMAPVSLEEGGVVYMSDKAPSMADDIRWAISTDCENPELFISQIDYLYSPEGALLCNYGIENETFVYDETGKPVFSELITSNPDFDYRTALFLNVMDAGPFLVDPIRGTATYTQEQLDSWSDWTDANLDYSHVIPNRVILKAQDSEYSAIMSDIETFMDEATVKYITGEFDFATYETDFVDALKAMNAERIIELYQASYDSFYGA